MLQNLSAFALLLFCAVFSGIFYAQRWRYRLRQRRGWTNPGFYPSTQALSESILRLQTTTQPQLIHMLEETQSESPEDEESGDDEEAAMRQHLHRQAIRIRNGERIDRLTVKLSRRRR